jgi:hypothetical protein
MLGSAASLMLSNARLHVEQSSDAFTLTVASLQRPVVVKRLDLKVAPGWQAYLKEEEKSRLATLEAAADSPSEPRVR